MYIGPETSVKQNFAGSHCRPATQQTTAPGCFRTDNASSVPCLYFRADLFRSRWPCSAQHIHQFVHAVAGIRVPRQLLQTSAQRAHPRAAMGAQSVRHISNDHTFRLPGICHHSIVIGQARRCGQPLLTRDKSTGATTQKGTSEMKTSIGIRLVIVTFALSGPAL
jgi:hypothetical protein